MKKIQKLLEAISLDIKPGDVILTGRFKNKRKIVKSIGTDKYGQPTVNGKSILEFKIEKNMPKKQWSAKSREELKESYNLRKLIRKLILEGPVKDEFDEAWYNSDTERETYKNADSEMGTFPRDAIDHGYQYRLDYTGDEIDQLFIDKRDLKRSWNETIDAKGLRSFWEGPKMKYFHSLSYYGNAKNAVDTLQQGEYSDNDIRDLSLASFLRDYKLTGNKDEMSTWGYYVPAQQISCPINQMTLGVLLKGRVTLATADDAWTESRSKASKKDMQRHKSSGLPKRVMPTNSNVNNLLFEEEDITDGRMGECILDNWGIEAIVYNPKIRTGYALEPMIKELAEKYNIPLISAQDAFGVP